MRNQGRTPRRLLLGLSLLAAVPLGFPCWQAVWFFTCYAPVLDAENTARREAAARGYRMQGYLGTILAEPDRLGGCEVQFEFADLSADPPHRDVTARLRRGWSLGGWEVVEMRERPGPPR